MAAQRVTELLVLVFTIATILFFLLRLTGDPATILAGENADPDFLQHVREQYGLDRPVLEQYFNFIRQAFQFDFGNSVRSGENAMSMVIGRMPPTLQMATFGIVINLIIAVPIGAWLGANPPAALKAVANMVMVVAQGLPGYVVGLLLMQVFAVRLQWLPSVGNEGGFSWVLPSATLAAFLIPRLTRVLATNVALAMEEDFCRTARASGASKFSVVVRHALPNALLGATALVGGQFAFLLSGALITEVIFAWPGVGRLLIDSVLQLDFPVVQAAVVVVAILVFLVNMLTDGVFALLDPRLRKRK